MDSRRKRVVQRQRPKIASDVVSKCDSDSDSTDVEYIEPSKPVTYCLDSTSSDEDNDNDNDIIVTEYSVSVPNFNLDVIPNHNLDAIPNCNLDSIPIKSTTTTSHSPLHLNNTSRQPSDVNIPVTTSSGTVSEITSCAGSTRLTKDSSSRKRRSISGTTTPTPSKKIDDSTASSLLPQVIPSKTTTESELSALDNIVPNSCNISNTASVTSKGLSPIISAKQSKIKENVTVTPNNLSSETAIPSKQPIVENIATMADDNVSSSVTCTTLSDLRIVNVCSLNESLSPVPNSYSSNISNIDTSLSNNCSQNKDLDDNLQYDSDVIFNEGRDSIIQVIDSTSEDIEKSTRPLSRNLATKRLRNTSAIESDSSDSTFSEPAPEDRRQGLHINAHFKKGNFLVRGPALDGSSNLYPIRYNKSISCSSKNKIINKRKHSTIKKKIDQSGNLQQMSTSSDDDNELQTITARDIVEDILKKNHKHKRIRMESENAIIEQQMNRNLCQENNYGQKNQLGNDKTTTSDTCQKEQNHNDRIALLSKNDCIEISSDDTNDCNKNNPTSNSISLDDRVNEQRNSDNQNESNCSQNKMAWNEEMHKFYNESWNGENFNLDEFLGGLDSNRELWKINRADRFRTITSAPHNISSGNDTSKGTLDCRNRQTRVVCKMCGVAGHHTYNCPRSICLTCGTKTTKFCKTCPNCLMRNVSVCDGCNALGHYQDECPEAWRRYHSTTGVNEVPNTKRQNNPRKMCCHCGGFGHIYDQCRRLNRNSFPSVGNNSTLRPKLYKDVAISPSSSTTVTKFTYDSNANYQFELNKKATKTNCYGRFLQAVGMDYLIPGNNNANETNQENVNDIEKPSTSAGINRNQIQQYNCFALSKNNLNIPEDNEEISDSSNATVEKDISMVPTNLYNIREDNQYISDSSNATMEKDISAVATNLNNIREDNQEIPNTPKASMEKDGQVSANLYNLRDDNQDISNLSNATMEKDILVAPSVENALNIDHSVSSHSEDCTNGSSSSLNNELSIRDLACRYKKHLYIDLPTNTMIALMEKEGNEFLDKMTKYYNVEVALAKSSENYRITLYGCNQKLQNFKSCLIGKLCKYSLQLPTNLHININIPKGAVAIYQFLRDNVLYLRRDIGDVNDLSYRLQVLEKKKNLKAKKKLIDRIKRLLNVILIGQAGFLNGKNYLLQLEQLTKQVVFCYRNKISVPLHIRIEIAECWRYIFTAHCCRNYGVLVGQYNELLQKEKCIPKPDIHEDLFSIDMFMESTLTTDSPALSPSQLGLEIGSEVYSPLLGVSTQNSNVSNDITLENQTALLSSDEGDEGGQLENRSPDNNLPETADNHTKNTPQSDSPYVESSTSVQTNKSYDVYLYDKESFLEGENFIIDNIKVKNIYRCQIKSPTQQVGDMQTNNPRIYTNNSVSPNSVMENGDNTEVENNMSNTINWTHKSFDCVRECMEFVEKNNPNLNMIQVLMKTQTDVIEQLCHNDYLSIVKFCKIIREQVEKM